MPKNSAINNNVAKKQHNPMVHNMNIEDVPSIKRSPSSSSSSKKKSKFLCFFTIIGTICAIVTATLIIVLLLLLYKRSAESMNKSSENATTNSSLFQNITVPMFTTSTTQNLSLTTVSSSTSTTVSFNSCYLSWNSTKLTVAGYNNGSSGSTSIALDHPRGIFIDRNDDLYIADNFNNRVQLWNINATAGTTIAGDPNGTAGWTGGKMYYPTFVQVDNSLNLYVVDNGNNRVLRYVPGATIGTTIAGTTGVSGNLSYAFGQVWTMAVDSSNNKIYLADLSYNRILVWPFFANDSSSIIPLDDIVGVTIDTTANIYATKHNLNKIVFFPAGSKNETVVVSSGLSQPWALRFDKYGNLYVANTVGGTIVMHCANFTSNSTGTIVASGLDQPVDMAFDSNMNMYVCEYGKHRVVKLAKLL